MSRKLIALCGAPGAGKTTVQQYLISAHGVLPVDDGEPMRDFAVRHAGLNRWHVSTQEGKASTVVVPGGKRVQVRDLLGRLGNAIEELLGPDAIPEMAITKCNDHRAYSFGSVRKNQGAVYKRHGGLVIEIVRPGYAPTNDFDRYANDCIDFSINNDGGLPALFGRIDHAVAAYLGAP